MHSVHFEPGVDFGKIPLDARKDYLLFTGSDRSYTGRTPINDNSDFSYIVKFIRILCEAVVLFWNINLVMP